MNKPQETPQSGTKVYEERVTIDGKNVVLSHNEPPVINAGVLANAEIFRMINIFAEKFSPSNIDKADGTQIVLGNKVEDVKVEANDVLHFITWGGGGWGDPLERDPEIVAKDIVQGLVTVEGARAYGVVIAEDGSVDTAATEALRAQIRAERPELGVLDFGPDIETLRANCEAETGLPAPTQPRWTHQQAS